ncbi:MAG: rod shape-determining protein MreC [Oscillospiraceae bacterium]|nr:rod shape-determining protein MreC [Oscillospiraceae bacterium]
MKRRLSRKGLIVLAAAAVIALITLISVSAGGRGGIFTSAVNGVSMPLKRLSAAVASQIESIYGYMYKYDEVVKENEQLHMQLAALERERREYVEVSEENEHFRQLLQLASRHSDYQFENASVISWGASNYTSSFTVSKGSENSDVAVGDSVITESGVLIGVITEVRDKTSVAVTVIDTKFSAGCVIESSGDTAVASGDYALMRRGMLTLDFLASDTRFITGDSVVTSGRGGVFPKGLVIGYIEDVEPDPAGNGSKVTVSPAADLRNVMDVFLITDFETSE